MKFFCYLGCIASFITIYFCGCDRVGQEEAVRDLTATNTQEECIRILFVSYKTRSQEIYSIDADGNNISRLTTNNDTDNSPCFSPNGRKILFISNRDFYDNLYVMDSNGKNPERLTNNNVQGISFISPQWTPDDRIFFLARERESGSYSMNIRDMNGMITKSKFPMLSLGIRRVSFSPDGEKIAALVDVKGFDDGLYIIDSNEATLTKINNTGKCDGVPSLSPDKKRVAFASQRDLDDIEKLYVMNVDGSELLKLTPDHLAIGRPVWFPDGKKLAFEAWDIEQAKSGKGPWALDTSIFVVNMDGTMLTKLTDKGGEVYSVGYVSK